MKKHNQKHLEGLSYEAPSVKTLDIQSEGLLCLSGGSPDRADNGYGDNIMDEI
jgi:hypothetical protein